ncbi:MAG: hypothetical protein NTY38_16795, partial [Acidobacteria bacterium]|nr:hypothetical protein [Acidobacteriota bacterium]
RVDAFDPRTERWTRLPDMPAPSGYAASTVVDGRLYAIGGTDGKTASAAVYVLGREGGEYRWREAGELPGPKVFAKAVRLGRSIALIGGMTRFEPYDAAGTCCTSVTARRDLLLFDTAHPERGWKAGASYPGPARWLWVAEAKGESLWIAGGMDQKEAKGPFTYFDEVLRYDRAGDGWTRVGVLPKEAVAAKSITSGMLGESVLLVTFARKIWEMKLSPFALIQREPLPEEAMVDGFFRIGDWIVGAGGENTVEGPRRRSEWTFLGTVR